MLACSRLHRCRQVAHSFAAWAIANAHAGFDRGECRRASADGESAGVACWHDESKPGPTREPCKSPRLWVRQSRCRRISSDDASAPTLQRSGWWRSGCCSSSRRMWSRCSAVIVCWTKPNHAFFMCQQPCAKFFSFASAHATTDAHRRASKSACRKRTATRPVLPCIAARKYWRGFQHLVALGAHRIE